MQAAFALIMLLLCCIHGSAQTITIRMLSGKTGKPVRDRSLRAEFQHSSEDAKDSLAESVITVDKHGIATLHIPSGATALSLIAPTRGKGSNQPAYTVCGPFGQFIPLKDILAHGFVPQNACNPTLHLTAQPGEILYLIEPLPWYTPALQ